MPAIQANQFHICSHPTTGPTDRILSGARASRQAFKDWHNSDGSLSLPLSGIGPGEIRAVSDRICPARLENGEFRAFSRYCLHQGSDLSLGVIRDGQVMCPRHNLPLDLASGASPCESLKKLRTYPCEVKDERVHVNAAAPS